MVRRLVTPGGRRRAVTAVFSAAVLTPGNSVARQQQRRPEALSVTAGGRFLFAGDDVSTDGCRRRRVTSRHGENDGTAAAVQRVHDVRGGHTDAVFDVVIVVVVVGGLGLFSTLLAVRRLLRQFIRLFVNLGAFVFRPSILKPDFHLHIYHYQFGLTFEYHTLQC